MKHIPRLIFFLILLCFVSKRSGAQVKDNFGFPEVITFDSLQYQLTTTYHPNNLYYKVVYLRTGESEDHFNKIITIDFVRTKADSYDFVNKKTKALMERKKTDPAVLIDELTNYKTGEYFLDFITSDQLSGNLNILDRNLCRYKNYTDPTGHNGVILFAITERVYGDSIKVYLKNLKKTIKFDRRKVLNLNIPDFIIK